MTSYTTIFAPLAPATGINGSEIVPIDQPDGSGGYATLSTTTAAIAALNASDMPSAETRTALATLDSATYPTAYLLEEGREGIFQWDASDLSALVTVDTQQGVYVAPASAPTGVSGAWVRRLAGKTCTPEMFGAVGDGVTDDTAALRGLSAVLSATDGGWVECRAGAVYLGGLQTTGGSNYLTGQALLYANGVSFFGVRGNGATIKFKSGMRFGAFDPATGLPIAGPSILASERADIGYAVDARNVGMFVCTDLIVDGSSDGAYLGGIWGDTGRQCIHYGISVSACDQTVLGNLLIFNSCLDGILYAYASLTSRSDAKPLLVQNVDIDSVGRNCFSLVGANLALFQNVNFSNSGAAPNTASGVFGSSPASCLDIEAEGGAYCQDVRVTASKLISGAGSNTAIVADSGTSYDILVEDTLMVGNVWLDKPRVRVVRCQVFGVLSSLYGGAAEANDNIQFTDCLISDDVSAFAGVPTPTSLVVDTQGAGAGVQFTNVTMKVANTRINLRGAIVRDSKIYYGTGTPIVASRDYAILANGGEWDRVLVFDSIPVAARPADAYYIERPTTAKFCNLTSATAKLRWNSWSTGAGGYEGALSNGELPGRNVALNKNLRNDFYAGKLGVYANNAVPASGTFERGAFAFNDTPGTASAAAFIFGWRATTAGTPGTWQSLICALNGTGSPEGVVTAPIGALYTRTDGGAGTTLYVKESGTGNTGWVGK